MMVMMDASSPTSKREEARGKAEKKYQSFHCYQTKFNMNYYRSKRACNAIYRQDMKICISISISLSEDIVIERNSETSAGVAILATRLLGGKKRLQRESDDGELRPSWGVESWEVSFIACK